MSESEIQAINISEDLARKMSNVAHHFDHADMVKKYAGKIAKGEGLPRREVFLAKIAGLWHDIGLDYSPDRQNHADKSEEMFIATFENTSLFTETEIEQVAFALKHHDKYQKALTLSTDDTKLQLLRILIDADTLELLGERGYIRAVETAQSKNYPDFDPKNPYGETSGYDAKQFDERFKLKREGKLTDVIEPTLIGQFNFQISCADLLFTETAKRMGKNGADFLRVKIAAIIG